jgi:hypothetical protein
MAVFAIGRAAGGYGGSSPRKTTVTPRAAVPLGTAARGVYRAKGNIGVKQNGSVFDRALNVAA